MGLGPWDGLDRVRVCLVWMEGWWRCAVPTSLIGHVAAATRVLGSVASVNAAGPTLLSPPNPRSTHRPTPRRLVKEVAAYGKEAQEQEAKVRAMKEGGRDPYDIKKQEEVLQESYMMIPDSKARLAAAAEDLKAFLVRFWVKRRSLD